MKILYIQLWTSNLIEVYHTPLSSWLFIYYFNLTIYIDRQIDTQTHKNIYNVMFWPNWLGDGTLTSHFFSSFNCLVYKTLMSMCLHVCILKMLCFLKLHLKIKPHFKILDIRKLANLIPDIFIGISTTTTQSWYIFRYIFFFLAVCFLLQYSYKFSTH